MKILKSILVISFLLNFGLSAAGYSNGSWDYKLPDEIGNLFKTKEKTDRHYGKAGQLLKDVCAERSRSETYSYTYDEVGNLIEKESITERWRYQWSQSGMLKKVLRPDGKHVDFTYDALGRRLTKTFKDQTTHFVWDGNTPLHEWTVLIDETISSINEKGEKELNVPENLTTWIFEDGTFIPVAKLQDGKSYSIITDHLGTPTEAYDEVGDKIWSRELGIYGQTRKETGLENFIPFKYQGQYEDSETGFFYNRFRYYDPSSGVYISQDPIGLDGGDNFYAYVHDSNSWTDPLGLAKGLSVSGQTALTDVPNRGIHVNVQDGKSKPIHVEIIGNKSDGIVADLTFAPADPAAKKIANAENPSKWNKIKKAVNEFIQNKKNAKKMQKVAEAAAENFPTNKRNFTDTANELGKICT